MTRQLVAPSRFHDEQMAERRMADTTRIRRLQFSLGWLLLAILILGPLLGIAGPVFFQLVENMRSPRPLPARPIRPFTFEAAPPDYYESGETPLD